jgi:hypothetical protein
MPLAASQTDLLKTSHTSTVGTLHESRKMRNKKSALACGETVQDEHWLWKQQEKIRDCPSPDIELLIYPNSWDSHISQGKILNSNEPI